MTDSRADWLTVCFYFWLASENWYWLLVERWLSSDLLMLTVVSHQQIAPEDWWVIDFCLSAGVFLPLLHKNPQWVFDLRLFVSICLHKPSHKAFRLQILTMQSWIFFWRNIFLTINELCNGQIWIFPECTVLKNIRESSNALFEINECLLAMRHMTHI